MCVSYSVVSDSLTPWTIARWAPLSIELSRQEYWSGLPLPSPRDLLDAGNEPGSPALQAGSLLRTIREALYFYTAYKEEIFFLIATGN